MWITHWHMERIGACASGGRPEALIELERVGRELDAELAGAIPAVEAEVDRFVGSRPEVAVRLDPALLGAVRAVAADWRALDRLAGDTGRALEWADEKRAADGGPDDALGRVVTGFGRGVGRFARGVGDGVVALGERKYENWTATGRIHEALRDRGLSGALDQALAELTRAVRRDAGLVGLSGRQLVDTFMVKNPTMAGLPYWSEQLRASGLASTAVAAAEYAGEALPEAALMAVGLRARAARGGSAGAGRTLGPPLSPPRRTSIGSGVVELPPSRSWGRTGSLDDHAARHGADVGATSAADYAGRASRFLQNALRDGLPTKIDAEGVIRVYDPQTNIFAAYNPDGTARTFFAPSRRAAYWTDQPGSAPWWW